MTLHCVAAKSESCSRFCQRALRCKCRGLIEMTEEVVARRKCILWFITPRLRRRKRHRILERVQGGSEMDQEKAMAAEVLPRLQHGHSEHVWPLPWLGAAWQHVIHPSLFQVHRTLLSSRLVSILVGYHCSPGRLSDHPAVLLYLNWWAPLGCTGITGHSGLPVSLSCSSVSQSAGRCPCRGHSCTPEGEREGTGGTAVTGRGPLCPSP